MFGRMALARAYLAVRPKQDWRKAVVYVEDVLEGERVLYSYCRFCGERLAGISLARYERARAQRRLRFSIDHHLLAGCPGQPSFRRVG